jgi:hypothetical protein
MREVGINEHRRMNKMSDKKFSVGKAILIGAGAAVAAAAAFGAVMYRQFKKDVEAGCGDEFCNCHNGEAEGETEINQGNYACVEKTDTDGVFTADTNGDGNVDTVLMDTNGDGNIDTVLTDTTGDGKLDTAVMDTNHDGEFDTVVPDVEPQQEESAE